MQHISACPGAILCPSQKQVPGISEERFVGKHWLSGALNEGGIAVDAT